jgi:hypothetical protein
MTHLRFRYKRTGYMRWRTRTSRRRTTLMLLPLSAARYSALGVPAWRRAFAAEVAPFAAPTTVLQVGGFLIGEEGDPQLLGHPDIRY